MKKFVISSMIIATLSQSVIANEIEHKIVEIGEKASIKLLKTLKGELIKAISKSPYEAINICRQKAINLTKKVEEEIDHGIKIKRTSFKYRNPQNAPDKYEEKALKFFEKAFKNGKHPKFYIQKLEENGKEYYRYYKPLKVGKVCLTCHGNPEHMDKKLYEKIKNYYPNDMAIGYKEGDFRGVIRVSIPRELVK